MKYTIEYSIGRYKIRVNFWLLIVFLLVQTLLNELGFWQLNRAKEKQVRIYQLQKGSESVITSLADLTERQIAQFQTVELFTEFKLRTTLLLDNKIRNQRPGYQVLHIVRDINSDKNLLINRGWVFAGDDRDRLPEVTLPNQSWKVKGRIYPIEDEALKTASARIENISRAIRLPVLDKQIVTDIEGRLNVELEPYVVRLSKNSEASLETDWVWTNMSPEKHLAYAVQWFSLALAFLIVSLVASIKKGE